MNNLLATLSSNAKVINYLNDGKEKDLIDLIYLLFCMPCEENTQVQLAELIRSSDKIEPAHAIILKDHDLPRVREIGRYALAEHSQVTMIQLLQMFNLSILHREKESSVEPDDTSFFINKIILHGDSNIHQLKFVQEKFEEKLSGETRKISKVDQKTKLRLQLTIDKKAC